MILIFALVFGICIFQAADYWTTYRILSSRGGDSPSFLKQLFFHGAGMRFIQFISKFYLLAFVLAGAWFGWFESATGFTFICILFMFYAAVVSRNLNIFKKQLVYHAIAERSRE